MNLIRKFGIVVGIITLIFIVDCKKALASNIETGHVIFTDSIPDDSIQNYLYLKSYIPTLHDELIMDRLNCLQKDVALSYNKLIKSFIHNYTIRNREYTQRILQRKDIYFPIFEEALKRHGMPDELKYLSIVESALRPSAVSPAAAVGLWQFIPSTGKEYGLHQDWLIDERMDPYKSTEAACKYLKYLYNTFHDWHLALAAYNCGPGAVMRAMRCSKKANFFDIYYCLPGETRAYVPMFIATVYSINHAEDHNIRNDAPFTAILSDTMVVNQYLNLEEFSKQTQITLDELKYLNPQLKKNVVPGYLKNYVLRVPATKKSYIDSNRISILEASRKVIAYPTYVNHSKTALTSIKGKVKQTHQVKYGEGITAIAQKYKVKPTDLRAWNKIRYNTIYPNQRLVIWVDKKEEKKELITTPTPIELVANTPLSKEKTNTKVPSKVHLVQPGDTLWNIAKRYGNIPVEKLKKLNNLKTNAIVPGQKLVIS